jgi:hypothetical protein
VPRSKRRSANQTPDSSAPSSAPPPDEETTAAEAAAVDDDGRADRIVSACLALVESGVGRLQKSALEPSELVDVANVARAVSAIRARPKKKDDDLSYEDLVERAKKYPELLEHLGVQPPIGGGKDEDDD